MRRPWATTGTIKKDTLVRILLRGEMGTNNVLQQEEMSKHTSFRVGGPADWVLYANSVEMLVKAVYAARRTKLPYRILGAGSNILVSDAGIEGIVILNKAENYELIEYQHGFALIAEAGLMMPTLATVLAKHGAAGLEWSIGIPGTVGGAVVRNAGAWGKETKNRLLSIEYIMSDQEQIKTISAHKLGLRSRGSNILSVPPNKRPIILNAWFKLDRDDPDAIAARNAKYLAKSKACWPDEPNAGSIFRDPAGDSAARLIEAAGLKGYRIGDAALSSKHPNFIVNYGDAMAQDIRALIELAEQTVHEKFGFSLEPLVEFVGHWDHAGRLAHQAGRLAGESTKETSQKADNQNHEEL